MTKRSVTELEYLLREEKERTDKLTYKNKDLEFRLKYLSERYETLFHRENRRLAEQFLAALLSNPYETETHSTEKLVDAAFFAARKFIEEATARKEIKP